MKKYSNNKDINNEVKSLRRMGWKYRPGKRHGAILSPNGMKLIIPSTPSDIRALYNFRRDVKHAIEGGACYAV